MPNHYSDIGFEVSSIDELNCIISQLMPSGRVVKKDFCRYLLITVDEHIELWQRMKSNNIYTSFEMHYAGQSSIPVRFDHWATRSDDFSSGSAYVWYHRGGDLFPFVIDLVNAGFYKKIKTGELLSVGVSCFAESLELFDTDLDFSKFQADEPKLASEFFIPTGTFSPDGSEKEPTADAWFGGHILAFEKRVNSVCGEDYFHFLVTCRDAVFDVVAAGELVTRKPIVGGVLRTSCWMSGKLK